VTGSEDLVENVQSHSRMSKMEKETSIHFCGDEEEASITSYKATIVKSLLEHDYAEVYRVVVETEEVSHKAVEVEDDDWDVVVDETIVGCHARLPIGCLTVKGSPRSNNYQSSIITTETEMPDGVFE
jgi:hypothetical protein